MTVEVDDDPRDPEGVVSGGVVLALCEKPKVRACLRGALHLDVPARAPQIIPAPLHPLFWHAATARQRAPIRYYPLARASLRSHGGARYPTHRDPGNGSGFKHRPSTGLLVRPLAAQ